MIKRTQTGDNCWQTCLAMLLDCVPESLPDQTVLDDHQEAGRSRYAHALRVFLRKHYNISYAEVGPDRFEEIAQRNIFHLMIGETVRTPETGNKHAVVGRGGKLYWDVHPSRMGLTEIFWFGLLIPIPVAWEAEWQKREAALDITMECVCCGCREVRSSCLDVIL